MRLAGSIHNMAQTSERHSLCKLSILLAVEIAEVVRQRNALIIHYNAARAACMTQPIPGAGHLPDGLEN